MGNFPGASIARQGGCVFLKEDSHGTPELLNAILEVFPLDIYTDSPAMLMQKMDCDKELGIPIWDKYTESVARHDPRGAEAVGFHARFNFAMRREPATARSRPTRPRYTQTSYLRQHRINTKIRIIQ